MLSEPKPEGSRLFSIMPIFLLEKKTGKYNFYGSLPELIRDYPGLIKSTVEHYITRKKEPYKDENIEIYKGELNRSKRK